MHLQKLCDIMVILSPTLVNLIGFQICRLGCSVFNEFPQQAISCCYTLVIEWSAAAGSKSSYCVTPPVCVPLGYLSATVHYFIWSPLFRCSNWFRPLVLCHRLHVVCSGRIISILIISRVTNKIIVICCSIWLNKNVCFISQGLPVRV